MNSESLALLKRELEEGAGTPERIEALRASLAQCTAPPGDAASLTLARLDLARALVYANDWKLATEGLRLLEEARQGGAGASEVDFLRCVGLLHTGAFLAARQATSALTLAEPTNPRAEALLELWKERAYSEGAQALKIAGIALAAVVLAGLAVYAWWPRGGHGAETGAAAFKGRRSGVGRPASGRIAGARM